MMGHIALVLEMSALIMVIIMDAVQSGEAIHAVTIEQEAFPQLQHAAELFIVAFLVTVRVAIHSVQESASHKQLFYSTDLITIGAMALLVVAVSAQPRGTHRIHANRLRC